MTWNRTAILAALPVAAVAVIAGVVSFTHIVALALRCDQTVTDARLLPFAVDGLIVAGVVIVLAGYWLGWLSVALGVGATIYANVMSGLLHGPLAATVAAWPAVAFSVASFVLERWLKWQATKSRDFLPSPVAVPGAVSDVPAEANGHDPDLAPFGAELARGEVPTIRRIRSELHVGQPRAQEIRARLTALARTP